MKSKVDKLFDNFGEFSEGERMNKVTPYDMWKEKADRTNHLATAYQQRKIVVLVLLASLTASLLLNVYYALTIC